MQNHLPAKLLAEFIGTFAFVFIGAGAGAVVGDGAGLNGIAAIVNSISAMSLLVPGRGAWCPCDSDEQAELVADCVELDGLAQRTVPRAGKGDPPILDDRRGAPTHDENAIG